MPLLDSTFGLIGPAVFDVFLRTQSSSIHHEADYDEIALAHAVRTKGIRAGLDVFDHEPAGWRMDDTHCQLEGVYGTHHIGASTTQAQTAVAIAACQTVLDWARTGTVRNCVNMQRQSSANARLIIRHHDQVGVLASVLEILKRAEINVQGMENEIFAGKDGAAAHAYRWKDS